MGWNRLVSRSATELGLDAAASEEARQSAGILELSSVADDEVAQAGDTFVMQLREPALLEVVTYQKQHLLVSSQPAARRLLSKQNFVEATIGVRSPLVGEPVRWASHLVEKYYEAGLVAVGLGEAPAEAEPEVARDGAQDTPASAPQPRVLAPGDRLVLLVAPGTELPRTDFLLVRQLGPLKPPVWFYDVVPVLLFAAGVIWASFDENAMVRVSVILFCGLVLFGWMDTKDVRHVMEWDILILIGASLALGTALSKSGLASAVGVLVRAANLGPQGSLFLLTAAVILLNEIVTNNAAATLGIPVAVELTKELGLTSVRPFAMAVLLGASASYACPIGYATHMVMGPGNYTLKHFLAFGLPLDFIYIAGITVILPWMFPLV